MPTVTRIIEAITNDNPHLYFFNQTEIRLQMSALSSNIYLSYFFSKNEIASYNKKIEDAVNKIDAILLASKCSVERIEDLELDNEEELIHELLIS